MKKTITFKHLKKLVKESADLAEGFLKGCIAKFKDEGVDPKDWKTLDDKFWNEMQEFLKNYGNGTDIKNFAISVNRKWSEMADSSTDRMFMALGDSIRQALLKSGAVRINENTKVTLTIGQIKRLVKEARKAPMWKKLDVELFRKAKRLLKQYGDDDRIDLDSLYVENFTDFDYLSDKYGFDAGDIVEAAMISCNQEAIDFFLDIAANLMPDCKVVTDNKYEIYVVRFANKVEPKEPDQAPASTANTDESNAALPDDEDIKIIKVTNIDWDIDREEHWDDDQPLDIADDEEHWDDDQIDDSEMTDDEKNEKFAELGLPTLDEVVEVPVPADWTKETDDGVVADWLSEEYRFCLNGWSLVKDKPSRKRGRK